MKTINLVEEFRRVRDIPFRIPLRVDDTDCCCAGKAGQLYRIYATAGYSIRHRICTFYWDDLPLPGKVRMLNHDAVCTHDFLEVRIARKWKIVDPTWDSGLKGVLPVNEWDGESNMSVAVPIKELFSFQRSLRVLKFDANEQTLIQDLERNGEFYRALNGWLQMERNRK